MSSKYKQPKKPAEPIDPVKLKVRRGELINFMNFMSTDENFCLRVWNTVQAVFERTKLEAEEAAKQTVVTESAALPCSSEIAEEHEEALIP